jgi:hypothetical protein
MAVTFNRPLRAVLAVVLVTSASARADDLPVRWAKTNNGFEAENKLPPGATIRITVTYLPNGATDIFVNKEKLAVKKVGDEIRAKVDKDGRLTIVSLGTAYTANHVKYGLVWGAEQIGGEKIEFTLGMKVKVVE